MIASSSAPPSRSKSDVGANNPNGKHSGQHTEGDDDDDDGVLSEIFSVKKVHSTDAQYRIDHGTRGEGN